MRNTLIATLGICLCAPALAGDYQRTVAADAIQQVTIGLASTDITVVGSKDKTIKLVADANVPLNVDGKTASLGSFDVEKTPKNAEQANLWHGGASELTVTMPAGVNLTVRTLGGEVTVKGLSGRAHLTVISGDIRIEQCTGAIDVEAVSGDIDIRGLAADLSAKSVSGEVTVRGLDSLMLEAKSVSGSVVVRESKARTVRISSHSGDVVYAGATPADGSVELTTFSGDAVVEVPAGAGFEVDAVTFSGEVSIVPDAEILRTL